jgi:hypothetical protein
MSRAAREAGPDRRQYLQVLLLVAPAALLAVMAWQHRWVGEATEGRSRAGHP